MPPAKSPTSLASKTKASTAAVPKPVAKTAVVSKAAAKAPVVKAAIAKPPVAKATVVKVAAVKSPDVTGAATATKTQPAARPAANRARPVVTPGSGNVVKLKDLLEQVAKTTGAKKKSVRDAVEATLHALGAALSRGDDLNLPSLGRAHVNRQRTLAEGEMIIVKLRRHDAKTGAKKDASAPLAATAKEG